MPIWLRRSLIALAVLLALLVAGAAWLIASFDANRYKGLAIEWMKREHDRTLVIAGPVELSVIPRLAISLSDVKLSERGRADEFAAVLAEIFGIEHPDVRSIWPRIEARHAEVFAAEAAAR